MLKQKVYSIISRKLSDNDSIGPNCNNKLKLRVDSLLNVKINGEFNQLNYFFSIKELKRKFKFEFWNHH